MNMLQKIWTKIWTLFLGTLLIYFTWFSWATPASANLLGNEKWTIAIGNEQSWSGRNGTGNLSYYGCDRQCECIYLTGGKISCRDGVCRSSWQNEKTTYMLESPITSIKNYIKSSTTLTISSDSQVNLTEKLYPKPFDNIPGPK